MRAYPRESRRVLWAFLGFLACAVVALCVASQPARADESPSDYQIFQLLYCPALYSYTGGGESWYRQMPENVQIVMTGGRTFGIANHQYAEKFKGNTGRAPFLWINWPCSDMARNFSFDWLTMGGHNTFLKSDVVPGDLSGIMLNPMQQSEASKQGIFMAADYAWNLWTSPEEGDKAWEDSFSYVEHNSPIANAASDGLRDLSANMRVHRDGGIDGRINDPDYDSSNKWWINHESDWEVAGLNISGTLKAAKSRLDSGTATSADIDAVEKIYGALGTAARNYREGAGDHALFSQMDPFVSSWDETCAAALGYVDAVRKAQGGNAEAAREALSAANALYTSSQSGHKIDYLGAQKDARVGLVVVTPTLSSLKADRQPAALHPEAQRHEQAQRLRPVRHDPEAFGPESGHERHRVPPPDR